MINRFRKFKAATFLMSTSGLLAFAGAASAQTTPAATAATTPTSTDTIVVITAAPRQEIKARQVQKDAPNLISVQSAETIAKYPDFNAAEALGRMPGISLSSDTGEGRFVQIRGIDANLNGATYGGVPLLNTNPGGTAASSSGRAVEYDTIPTGAINGIVVTYTGMPDHDAEGLGGSIELSPRTAADITKPFADATVGGGYEPLHDHSGPTTGEIAFGARFGFDDKGLVVQNGDTQPQARAGWISNPTPFSFVLNASYKEDRRAVDDIEESYIDDGAAPSNAIDEYQLRRYNYHRTRFGNGGEFDFKPNSDHSYYIRADVAGYIESVNKNFLLLTNMGDVEGPTGQIPADPGNANGYLVTTQPEITSTDEREKHVNEVYVIGGADRFGDLTLDYHAAYSSASFTEDHSIGAKFKGPKNVPLTYDNVSNADYPILGFPNGIAQINDAANYTLSSLSNEQDYDHDKEDSYAINALLKQKLFTDDDQFKFGVQARLRDKSASEYDESYSPAALSLASLSTPAINYYNGVFSNGPQINIPAIANLVYNGGIQDGPPVFNTGSYFSAREDIYAAYGQYMTRIGKWGVLAGVRLEQTDAVYGGYIATTNPDGSAGPNTFQTRTNDYLNAFPTVQVRYDFDPTLALRATYSTGIGRPGFLQNSTSASVDLSQNTVTRGNPALKPTLGSNFDLSLEKYLPEGGIIQVGAFDKEFTNYIAPRIQNGVNDPLDPGNLAQVTTFLNIPNGYARGVDASYHQKFVWLPRPFNGLGVEANLTLVDSRFLEYDAATSGTGKNEYGMLPGTSADTWNLALFYEAYGFQARLSAEYISHSLFGLGGDRSLDTIQDNRQLLDFSSSYKINKNWSVYFNAKNLNNAPLRYYEDSPDRPIQREFYDATYEAGIRANF